MGQKWHLENFSRTGKVKLECPGPLLKKISLPGGSHCCPLTFFSSGYFSSGYFPFWVHGKQTMSLGRKFIVLRAYSFGEQRKEESATLNTLLSSGWQAALVLQQFLLDCRSG